MQHEIEFGTERITFSLTFSARRTLGIAVHPDQSVHVHAPATADIQEVHKKVRRRAPWILRQLGEFRAYVYLQPPRNYISGESYRYLGRQYLLKVIPASTDESEWVKLRGSQLLLSVKDTADWHRKGGLLERWYREHAGAKFAERLDVCHEIIRRYGVEKPSFRVQRMSQRWGSCTGTGAILLNPVLIQTPTICIDYVIMHELCHLKVLSHDRRFTSLLTAVMPDWERRKGRLSTYA